MLLIETDTEVATSFQQTIIHLISMSHEGRGELGYRLVSLPSLSYVLHLGNTRSFVTCYRPKYACVSNTLSSSFVPMGLGIKTASERYTLSE